MVKDHSNSEYFLYIQYFQEEEPNERKHYTLYGDHQSGSTQMRLLF